MNDTTSAVHSALLAAKACAALEKNGFNALYLPTAAEAAAFVTELFTSGQTVGFGGSMTIKALGLREAAKQAGAIVLDHSANGLSSDEKLTVMRAQLTCDLFLSGTNALTLTGELLNIDGNGNRVAALTFGPKKTVVVVGINKLVRDTAEALIRLEEKASPMNNIRLGYKNPCVTTGVCMDCKSDTRICRVYSILKRRPFRSDFTVLIIGEALGY